MNLFFLSAGAMLASALGTSAVRAYALRRLMDLPNARSSHSAPTPRGGGLAIVAAVTAAVAVLWANDLLARDFALALLGTLPVAAAGFWDDHGHVSARIRLAVQVVSAVWALAWLHGPAVWAFGGQVYALGLFGSAMAMFWIVWMLNLFNFMDGIDGIAGVEVATVTLSAAGLLIFSGGPGQMESGAVLSVLGCAAAGFLWWNWPPARIFMGDVGSGFVGILIALIALKTIGDGQLSPAIWLILPAVFIGDASLTLARRVLSGQKWTEAHRSHAYQHAARRFGAHRPVTLAVAAINLFWLLPLAAMAKIWPGLDAVWIALAYGPLGTLAWRLDAGKP